MIYSDSLSALESLRSYSQKHSLIEEIKFLFNKILESNLMVVLCWIPSHINIKGNEEADKAAKHAIIAQNIEKKIPINDILSSVKAKMKQKWQKEWEDFPANNKLRSVKKRIDPWPSSIQKNRFFETLLNAIANWSHKAYT